MTSRSFHRSAVLLLVFVATVGGSVAQAADGRAALLTRGGQDAYLLERGVDPADAIIQVGPRLYAGPGCPAGYACVDPAGAPVLQVVTTTRAGVPGMALAKCSGNPSDVTTTQPGDSCVVMQVVPSGGAPADLVADCTHGTPSARLFDGAATSSIVRACSISQDNASGGDNAATVSIATEQRNEMGGEPDSPANGSHQVDQDLLATVGIDQDAVAAGTNTASVVIDSLQVALAKSVKGGVNHVQDAKVRTDLTQNGENDNTATVTHQITERAHTKNSASGPLTILQNSHDDGDADSFAFIRQNSTSGDSAVGFNTLTLTMDETLDTNARSRGNGVVTATQGSAGGGLIGDIDGDADGQPPAGSSSYHATLSKSFTQIIEGGGSKQMIQDDVIDCCDLPAGFSNSYDHCTLDFDAALAQSPVGAQDLEMRGTAEVDGSCDATFDGSTDSDSFSHTENDVQRVAFNAECTGGGQCQTNRAPGAQDVSSSGDEDTVIAWQPVVSDPEADVLTCQAWTEDPPTAQHGTVSVDPNCGPSTYTPDPEFSGPDSFQYVARDPSGLFSRRATVTVTVAPVNDPPVAGDDTASTDEEVPVVIDVLANDSDIDGPLVASSVVITDGPSSGVAASNGDGTITYAPVTDFYGTDGFVYRVCDQGGLCDEASVVIAVANVPEGPASSLQLAVRNPSTNSPYGTQASVGIAPDNRAQYRITYTNAGDLAADGVVVRHPIPAGASLVAGSCSGGPCQASGGQVVFSLGQRPVGALELTFTLAFNPSFQNATTQATGSSVQEGAFTPSNSVTVVNICIQTPTSPLCDPF